MFFFFFFFFFFGLQGSMNALFLNHDGYLGALGTFVAPLVEHQP
jgi:pantothenate kinase